MEVQGAEFEFPNYHHDHNIMCPHKMFYKKTVIIYVMGDLHYYL